MPDDTTAPVTARDGEIIRLRNRTRALEANGAELLARAKRAEAAIERVRTHADEIGAMALADWESDDASQAVRAEMLRNARAIYRALDGAHSPADAPTPVSAATEAHGGAGEAQEG